MKKYKIILKSLFLLLFAVSVSCKSGNKANVEVKEEEENLPEDIVELRDDQAKLAEIEIGAIETRSLSGTLKVNGTVSVPPQSFASVCAPMGGFIKNITLMPGNPVSKGQTLATIENPEFIQLQQDYIETRNKLEFADAEYKRHTDLYKDEVYSQKNLQQVTVEYKNLKAQLKALEQKLSIIGINASNLSESNINNTIALRSPINGFVKSVNVNIGKNVSPSDVLFEIVNNDKLFLELTLFEKDADKISAGQKIRFFINNETDEHQAIVSQAGRSVNADKTYKVYANVISRCKNLIPGMYVNAVVEATSNKVTALPSDAVVTFDDKSYIFIFNKTKTEDGKPFTEYRMVEVQKGVSDQGYTEVILPDGFDTANAKVVIKGAYNLLSAMKNAGEMAC